MVNTNKVVLLGGLTEHRQQLTEEQCDRFPLVFWRYFLHSTGIIMHFPTLSSTDSATVLTQRNIPLLWVARGYATKQRNKITPHLSPKTSLSTVTFPKRRWHVFTLVPRSPSSSAPAAAVLTRRSFPASRSYHPLDALSPCAVFGGDSNGCFSARLAELSVGDDLSDSFPVGLSEREDSDDDVWHPW